MGAIILSWSNSRLVDDETLNVLQMGGLSSWRDVMLRTRLIRRMRSGDLDGIVDGGKNGGVEDGYFGGLVAALSPHYLCLSMFHCPRCRVPPPRLVGGGVTYY
jgi:hypothetical protein